MKVNFIFAMVLCFAGQALRLGSGQALAQDSSNVRTVGSWPFGGCYTVSKASVAGQDYALIGSGGGILMVDVTSLVKIEEFATPGLVKDIFVKDEYAYIADGSAGLRIIDIKNPYSFIEVGCYDTPGNANKVYISGNYAYIADGITGIQIVDISDPFFPALKGSYDTPISAEGIFISGSNAY
ncbi:MAG: LVIVD repeat-containing protein, partial [Desulfocucumaceae bacterium]